MPDHENFRRSRPKPNGNVPTIIMGALLCIGVMAFLSRDRNPRPVVQQQQQQIAIRQPTDRAWTSLAGEQVRLSLSSPKPDDLLLLGVTANDQGEFVRLATSKDSTGVSRMLITGRLIAAPNGSTATMIEAGVFSHRVKINSGPNAGQEGWIAVEFVRGL